MRAKLLMSLVSIASLLLIQACNSSGGGGGGGTPDNGQSSEAAITSLVVSVSGTDHTIDFDANREATVDYPYSATALTSVTVKSIGISVDATSDYDGGETINVTDGKATITVTAQDGTEQTYTINLVQAQPNTGADITSLVVTVSDTDHTIDFDANRESTVDYPYSATALTSVTVKSIGISVDATSDYDGGETINVTDGKITITVTAQDGTTKQEYSITFVQNKPRSLRHILDGTGTSTVPTATDLLVYDELTQAVLAPYNAGATLVARYITIHGGVRTQGGLSWDDAAPASQLKPILDSISDASSDRIYLLLLASSSTTGVFYAPGEKMPMKDHVAIIGGWDVNGGWDRSGSTILSGERSYGIFFSNDLSATRENPFGHTSLLYGLTIVSAKSFRGSAIYNYYSSPTLINLTLSANSSEDRGGAIYNSYSSPTMTNITLSANSSEKSGGAIYNHKSSPTMTNITLSANSAVEYGGAIYNYESSPTMTNITFSANSSEKSGGAIYNSSLSSPTMTNITLSANSAGQQGGAIYNNQSSVTMTNITFSDNSADKGGAIYIKNRTSSTIVGSIFWGNTATNGAQIYIEDATGDTITLAYSVIEGGAPANVTTTSTNLVTTDPSLADLTTDAGSAVATHAISTGSSAINAGIYVRRLDYTDQSGDAKSRWYYSEDNSNWYTGFDSSGLTDSTSDASAEAEGSIDITETDATGTARSDRPDAGAYEAR